MAKKLLPEYNIGLTSEVVVNGGTINNIYGAIDESEKSFYSQIVGLKLNKQNQVISLADIARNFISKNQDDIVSGVLSFSKNIKSDNFTSGANGKGWKLEKDEYGNGNLEIDNLVVRKELFTNILTHNKINALGGTIVLSAAWAEITRVEEFGTGESHYIRCYYKPDGTGIQAWMVNDIVKLQSGSNKYLISKIISTSSVLNSDGEHAVDIYHGDDVSIKDGDTIPSAGDTIVQYGRTQSDVPSRQNLIIMSTGNNGYPYIEQYKGVDSYMTISEKIITRISDDVYFGNTAKTKYLWWNKDSNGEFLIKGTLTQSPSDETFPLPVWRGEYSSITQYYVGDMVSYEGSTYMCKLDSVGVLPTVTTNWDIYSLNGDASSIAILSNETHIIPSESDGSNPDFSNSGTTISAYYGTIQLSYEMGTGYPTTNGRFRVQFSTTNVSSSSTSGGIPASGQNAIVGNLSAMPIDTGSLNFSIYLRVEDKDILIYKTQRFAKAKKGTTGDVGKTVRYSRWKSGVNYFAGNIDDGGTNNNTAKYIDYVTNYGTDGVMRAYQCKVYHTSAPANEPLTGGETTFWKVISYLPAIATDLVLANQAVIGGFLFSQAIDASGVEVAAEDQYMRTTDSDSDPAIKLSGDGSGRVAKGKLRWGVDSGGTPNPDIIRLDFSKKIDVFNSDGNYTPSASAMENILITNDPTDGDGARIKLSDDLSHITEVSPRGLFANNAGQQAVPVSSGMELKASVVGLGFGNLKKSAYGNTANICGVYGDSTNSNADPAPSWGGYFRKLFAKGFYSQVQTITTNTQLTEYSHTVICLNQSAAIDVNLPTAPQMGQHIIVKTYYAQNVVVRTSGNLIARHSGVPTTSALTISSADNGTSIEFIWDGDYWFTFIHGR